MINDQLISYIKQQLERGISEEVIKNELLKVGWKETDFSEAMEKIKPSAYKDKTEILAGEAPNEITAQASQEAAAGTLEEKQQPELATADLPQEEKKETNEGGGAKSLFEVKELIDVSNLSGSELKEVNLQEEVSPGQESSSEEITKQATPDDKQKTAAGSSLVSGNVFPKLALGILGLLALVGLGVGGFFYLKNSKLESSASLLNSEKESLNNEISRLSKEKSDLEKQIGSLLESNRALEEQLSIFAIPPDASSSEEMPLTVKGTLKLAKDQFTLTTDKSIVVYVKNSKDAKVKAALEPFVGTIVELSGVHLVGSPNLVVSAVNGKPIE